MIGVLLIMAALGLFHIPFLDTVVRNIFVPAQRFVTNTVQNTQKYFESMTYERQIESAYQILLEELKAYKAQSVEMEELRRENSRLSGLMNRTAEYEESERLLAKVVAMSPNNWFSAFTIDRGIKDGIQKDDTVIVADGLVGRISETYDQYSTVITLVDSRSSVAGLIERTRDNGVVRGNLYVNEQDEACRMFYLPQEVEYQPGDRILTSGLDGIYPKGLLIGQVKGISSEMGSERYIVVSPSVNFQRIEEVVVLINMRASDLPEELVP